jgi:hypothetical protein
VGSHLRGGFSSFVTQLSEFRLISSANFWFLGPAYHQTIVFFGGEKMFLDEVGWIFFSLPIPSAATILKKKPTVREEESTNNLQE